MSDSSSAMMIRHFSAGWPERFMCRVPVDRHACLSPKRAVTQVAQSPPEHYYSHLGKESVGARGFEPPTTGTPYRCATGLRHAPFVTLRVYRRGGTASNATPPQCHALRRQCSEPVRAT